MLEKHEAGGSPIDQIGDAIQDILFACSNRLRPRADSTIDDQADHDAKAALRTLRDSPAIVIPGEDAERWIVNLRLEAGRALDIARNRSRRSPDDLAEAERLCRSLKARQDLLWALGRTAGPIGKGRNTMSIDDAEQQSLHAKEIAFLRAVTDPQELLRFCQDARKGLASSDPFRQYNAWHSPVILREVWDAMFRIGGAVPHAPALLKIEDSAAAFAGLLLGEPDRYACPIDAINAFSAATAWCNAFAENLPNGSPPAAIVGPGNGKAGGEQSEGGDIGRRLDDGPGPADEELNDRQRDILEAMLKNDISGANRREKLNNIVKRINQIVKSINRIQNAATCGRDFAGLVKLGYLASREGPLGGYWLTSKGKIEALRLHTPG